MANQERILQAQERQLQALELRKAGVTYAAIAQKLGYKTADGAHKAVGSALKKSIQEPADALRTLEVERLDAMLLAIAAQVRGGNLGAIDRALRIMERRAKLLGLDMPTRHEMTGAEGAPLISRIEIIKQVESASYNPDDQTD